MPDRGRWWVSRLGRLVVAMRYLRAAEPMFFLNIPGDTTWAPEA